VRLGISGDGSALRIEVPSDYFREWIKGHFSPSLIEAGQAVVGRQLRLDFSVHPEPERTTLAAARRDTNAGDSRQLVQMPSSSWDAGVAESVPPGRVISRDDRSTARLTRTLVSFITGSSNRLACAAAGAMIQTAGTSFNPLLIHGGVGLGKTHLLEAIVQGLRQVHPSLTVLGITAEAFTNAFLDAMRSGTLSRFRTWHRGLGALAMDDVHFLAGTRATQNEFLHTFNALVERGAPIVVTADRHPRRISRLTDELVTRFLGGMVVQLEAPDLATRRAILQAKVDARGMAVPGAILDYIAEHLRSSIRELEGALHSVVAQATLTGKRLDLALAKTALRDTIRLTSQTVSLRAVEQAVCQLFQIEMDDLKSESRARSLAYPRMVAMYLARKHTGAAYTEIGRHFGDRNHSTVISAERKVERWLRDEKQSAFLPGFETIIDVLADLEKTLGA
jgi:chromosomal replication initiator protein